MAISGQVKQQILSSINVYQVTESVRIFSLVTFWESE